MQSDSKNGLLDERSGCSELIVSRCIPGFLAVSMPAPKSFGPRSAGLGICVVHVTPDAGHAEVLQCRASHTLAHRWRSARWCCTTMVTLAQSKTALDTNLPLSPQDCV